MESNDSVMFEHLHYLLDEQGRAESFERRRLERKPFATVQWIAECSGDSSRLLAVNFEKRDCFDISPNGIAFFSPYKPACSHITVTLGTVPLRFILAEVRHSKQVEDGRWLVGCQMVKKLN